MSNKSITTATKEVGKTALVPKRRFPEFLDAAGWDTTPGDELFEQINNRQALAGLPILAITQEHGAIPRDLIDYHVSVTDKSVETYKEVRPGDFIISLRSFQGGIEYSQYHGICSPAYVVLRKRAELSDLFYKQHFKSHNFIQQLTKNLEGLRDGKMISYKQFSELLLLNPSSDEQQKIAECLSSVDELMAAQARKLDALKTHKKGLMQQLFPREGETQPRLRFPEFQNAGVWDNKSLGQLIEIASGQVDPKQLPYCDSPQIGSENIESHSGKLVNVRSASDKGVISGNYAFDENDILYSKIRPALNKVAAPAFKGICSADIYPIRPADESLLRIYLFYLLLSQEFLDYAIRNSERGKIPKINREALVTYKTLIPPPDEQKRITDCLTSLDDLITAEAQKLDAIKTHKKGLMQQLFPSPDEQDTP